jgi:hypothetical protein
VGAASRMARKVDWVIEALFGLRSTATRTALGKKSCRSRSRFAATSTLKKLLHREVVWVISANFDQLSAVDVVAVGMWATRLRCPSCP